MSHQTLLFTAMFTLIGVYEAGLTMPRLDTSKIHDQPMVCNNATEYQCICRLSSTHEVNSQIECDQFIQSKELPVVDMRLRHVNLEAHLHTNEKYETYFKRRIANIVSSYCEHQANECPGASLRLVETDTSKIADDKSVLYASDESEPLLTQENVVLLRVEREPGNVTRILFAIIKSLNVGSLNEQMIIDPVKVFRFLNINRLYVKYILGSQAGPLARILGGIKLDSVRVSRIKRALKTADMDNSKLLIFVSIVGIFFVICYIIGGYRLYRDSLKRKRDRKRQTDTTNGLVESKAVPNYGACASKIEEKESRNGATFKKSIEELPYLNEYSQINECVGYEQEPHVISERAAHFMFMCDPSQLPREPTFDSQICLETEELETSSRKSISLQNVTLIKKNEQVTELNRRLSMTEEPSSDQEVPALVLVPSLSIDSPITSDDSPSFATIDTSIAGSECPPLHRPKSRRGSHVDDEVLDLREIETPSVKEVRSNDDELTEKRREQDSSRWSSSEGEVEVYYKLSDEEDIIKGDDWEIKTIEPDVEQKISNRESDSEADDEESVRPLVESEPDNFVYERLREELTPIPPDS
uniref:Recep_L_domain domain-containing protein n=1 Tax=Heterorhabditis bacteriophora TaxID=37862 RepID=A0A1I7WX85_HETBA